MSPSETCPRKSLLKLPYGLSEGRPHRRRPKSKRDRVLVGPVGTGDILTTGEGHEGESEAEGDEKEDNREEGDVVHHVADDYVEHADGLEVSSQVW